MDQIQKVRKCYTCGATLQSEDPSKEGYINPEILQNPTQKFFFCQKCFEAERYRSVSNEPFIDYEFIDVLKEAKAKESLLVYIQVFLHLLGKGTVDEFGKRVCLFTGIQDRDLLKFVRLRHQRHSQGQYQRQRQHHCQQFLHVFTLLLFS